MAAAAGLQLGAYMLCQVLALAAVACAECDFGERSQVGLLKACRCNPLAMDQHRVSQRVFSSKPCFAEGNVQAKVKSLSQYFYIN